jgi:hydrophobic/amphiphilic exporter-1 (mainly G- bacteria), HAE1 family
LFVDFFIQRPVLAMVTAMLIVLVGAICIPLLPIGRFPILAPPAVSVYTNYLGASAQTVETAVTTPIEQQINGVQGLRYLTSTSSNDGSSSITATFDVDRDQDLAAVDIQNRVNQAQGRLPAEVKQAGIFVDKGSNQFVCGLSLYSEGGTYSSLFLSNYADVFVRDALKRVPGVSNVQVWGERKYSIRIWLDPLRLAARKLTAGDVVTALREQNVQVAAGAVGSPPSIDGQAYQLAIRAEGRFTSPEEFGRVILKSGSDGTLVLLSDVARVELGAEDYSGYLRFHGRETVGLGIEQLPTANALDVDHAVMAKMAELAKSFPPGIKYESAFDPTSVVSDSIREVVTALLLSILLVMLVILVFLQSFRSTLIAAITIPVSLVGTFAFIKLFGFSINTLTLFGLTLATGLVVDDAIVVIENIERHLERGEPLIQAASRGMREVTGAVIATSLVLIAVFVPVAFFPGITGRLYKQFSLTIAFSVAISTFNAVTLTPALSALLLRHSATKGGFFRGAERALAGLSRLYERSLGSATRQKIVVIVLFVAGLAGTYWLFGHVPKGFAPEEDDGYFMIVTQGPEGSSLGTTIDVVKQAEAILDKQPEVIGVFGIAGNDGAPNRGLAFASLKPIDQRPGHAHSAAAVLQRVRQPLSQIPGAMVFAFAPPPLPGLGDFGGFQFEVLDQGAGTPDELAAATHDVVAAGNKDPLLQGLFSQYTANDPQLLVEIDRQRAKGLGISFTDIADTLEIYMGSAYVNDFDFNNRSYRVYVQADKRFRSEPKDMAEYYVRSSKGDMLPLENVVKVRQTTSPQTINHYNLFRSAEISGNPAPGVSSGQALSELEAVARRVLPTGFGFAWTGLALEEISAGRTTAIIFSLALLFVFLVLAALYESFVLPVIILMAVPVAILGALGAQALRGLENDVYCQIGLVMLVGLASKNAILIVEFAERLRLEGRSIVAAAVEASRERLRPILMTSFAFIFGMAPLVFATGAGANSRHSLGTAVTGGMLVSTILNLYVTPVLYILVQSLWQALKRGKAPVEAVPLA